MKDYITQLAKDIAIRAIEVWEPDSRKVPIGHLCDDIMYVIKKEVIRAWTADPDIYWSYRIEFTMNETVGGLICVIGERVNDGDIDIAGIGFCENIEDHNALKKLNKILEEINFTLQERVAYYISRSK